MARPVKRRGQYLTNLDMPCNGVDCPKPLPHNHRKRISCRTLEEFDLKTAELKLMRKQLKHGVTKGEISWQAFKQRFLPYSQGKHAQTHYRDTLAIRYLEKFYPVSELKQITPELLTGLKQKLKENKKGAWNINRVLTALKAMMRFAELSKFIDPQIWRFTRPIPTPRGRLLYWKTDEIIALYAHCRGKWLTIAKLAIEAGLRREEIHTLKLENVDFIRNRINIVGDETWIPKDFERRVIPMKLSLSKHLKTLKGIYAIGDDRPTLSSMSSYFRDLVDKANLPGSLHTGRHSYGSHSAMQGIPLAIIQQRMGHESIKTTQIYAHLCPDITQEMYAA